MSRSLRIVNFIAAVTGRPQLRLSAEGIAARHQFAKSSPAHDGHAMPLDSAPRLADRLRHAGEEQDGKGAERNVGRAHPTRIVSGKATKPVGRDWGLLLSQQACVKESLDLNDPQLRLLLQRLLTLLSDIREHQVRSRARSVALPPPQLVPVALAVSAVAHFNPPRLGVRRRIGGFLTGIGLSGLFGALLYLLTA
jgi:hypothetical protein